MNRDWPEAVQRVSAFLRDAGAEARIEEFSVGTPTAADAARAIGCTESRIVKSLVFEHDDRSVVALVPGDRRADAAKLAVAVGVEHVRIVSPDRIRSITGFERGAVCPFPLPGVDNVVLERRLLGADRVWVGAGSSHHMVGLAPGELLRLSRAVARDIVADD